MKKTHLFHFMTALFILAGLSACSGGQKAEPELQRVRVYKVETQSGVMHMLYPGRSQAAESSNVAFKVAGTLAKVSVRVGDRVSRGQVLAVMDDHDYRVQLNATRAEYESTKAECERIIALYKDQGTTENNYDKARYGLEQITMKLQHAEDQVNNCRIVAPYDGFVQAIYHEQGETIGAGMAVVSLFASSGLEIVINIPAMDYQRRHLVDNFTATFNAIPGQTFPLTLKNVSAKANINQLYEVRLSLDKSATHVTPGMTAMVDLQLHPLEGAAVEVPSTAILADSDGKSYAFLLDEEAGVVRRVPVSVKSLTTTGMAVVTSGVKPGDLVVSAGVHHISDGQRVQRNPEPSKTNVGGLL